MCAVRTGFCKAQSDASVALCGILMAWYVLYAFWMDDGYMIWLLWSLGLVVGNDCSPVVLHENSYCGSKQFFYCLVLLFLVIFFF